MVVCGCWWLVVGDWWFVLVVVWFVVVGGLVVGGLWFVVVVWLVVVGIHTQVAVMTHLKWRELERRLNNQPIVESSNRRDVERRDVDDVRLIASQGQSEPCPIDPSRNPVSVL